jgi:hypothetical protein
MQKQQEVLVDLSAFMRARRKMDNVLAELLSETHNLGDDFTTSSITDWTRSPWTDDHGPREWYISHEDDGRWIVSSRIRPSTPPKAPPPPPPAVELTQEEVTEAYIARYNHSLRMQEVLPELLDRTTWLRRGIDTLTDGYYANVYPKRQTDFWRTRGSYDLIGAIENTDQGWHINMFHMQHKSFNHHRLICVRRAPYAQK